MLSNLVSQLAEMKQEDKFEAVLEEVPRVRKDFGEPPLVTPSSQIVGTQAVLNVVLGERYKQFTKESRDLLAGKYGQTVKPMNPEVVAKIIPGETPITDRPADHIEPQLEKYKKEMGFLGNVSGRDENKIAEARLHVGLFDDVPYIDEANLVIVCKTIAKTPLPVEDVIDKDYAEKFYPTGDFHNIYICEIEKIYAR
jgi:pyruvate/oxaloacetate carboxyltransferase